MHRALLVVGLMLCLASQTLGQSRESGQVSGAGTVEIKRTAEALRVQVELTAKGKDMKEALAKLKERKNAAQSQLAGLGVAKDAVAFGETALTTAMTDQQRQMEMMVMQRRGGRKPDGKNKQPDPIVVGCTLKADFPLEAGSGDEQLIACHALQEKIKAADLGGAKETEKLTAKEEELAEEMEEMGRAMYQQGQAKPGEPTFLYVAKIPAAEREKALREAYRKAVDQAARLAAAADMELGPLHALSSHTQMDPVEPEMNPYAMRAAARYVRGLSGDSADDLDEAVGPSLTKVTVKVLVNASFTLKGKK